MSAPAYSSMDAEKQQTYFKLWKDACIEVTGLGYCKSTDPTYKEVRKCFDKKMDALNPQRVVFRKQAQKMGFQSPPKWGTPEYERVETALKKAAYAEYVKREGAVRDDADTDIEGSSSPPRHVEEPYSQKGILRSKSVRLA